MLTESLIKNILTQQLYGNTLCESINQKRIVDYFYKELLLEKLLIGEPITVPELRKLLRDKIVNFEFIKLGDKNGKGKGEVRPAKGTTNMKYIPSSDHPKGKRSSYKSVAAFWDLSKKAWRSVSDKSKEIVLKDNNDDSAIVTVRDKKDVIPNQVIVKKVAAKEPEKKEEPIKKEIITKKTVEEPKKVEPVKAEEPKQPAIVKPIEEKPTAAGPEIKTFATENPAEVKQNTTILEPKKQGEQK